MPRFYLSRLRAAGGRLGAPVPGAWSNDAGANNFLTSLRNDIDVGGIVQDPSKVHSAPSVFARPILFAQAFNDPTSPVHAAVIDEWRGLLAIFALRSWYGYPLNIETYTIPPIPANAASAVGNVPGNGLHLNTMLLGQLPGNAALWNPLRIVTCGNPGEMVGCASPWTMLFTPSQYRVPACIPWKNTGGMLCDPIKLLAQPGKTCLELTFLYHWINLLLAGQPWGLGAAVPGMFLADVNTQLQNWANELVPYVDPGWTLPGLAGQDANAGPYSGFMRSGLTPAPIMPDGGPVGPIPAQSDLFIRATQPGVGSVVVLKSAGLPPMKRIFNSAWVHNTDLAGLQESSGRSITTTGGIAHNVEWIMAEKIFFPRRLARVNLSAAALTCPGAAANYSLPITPEFFKYFRHQDVAGMMQVAVAGADPNIVLTVTLAIPTQGGEPLVLTKQYNLPNDLADVGAATPAFAIWPDFYEQRWSENFAAFVGPNQNGDPNFSVAPFRLSTTGNNAVNVVSEVPTSVNGLEKEMRIWKCTAPPLGFALQSDGMSAGIVLRRTLSPATATVPDLTWEVAVDFGTANSMLMRRVNGGLSQPLPLLCRLILLNTSSDDRMTLIENNLFPRESVNSPFRTLLYNSEATMIGNPAHAYSVRFDFVPHDVESLIQNLKWGGNGDALRSYLDWLVRSVVTEARAAGVPHLKLWWSYPLALPGSSHQAMTAFWNALAAHYAPGSGHNRGSRRPHVR